MRKLENFMKTLLLLILITIIMLALTGCANFGGTKTIDLSNAQAECKFFGVLGTGLKKQAPLFTVNIVKDDITEYCGNYQGCLHNGKDIYTEHNDWKIIGHEKCHGLFAVSWHTNRHKPIYSPILASKDR